MRAGARDKELGSTDYGTMPFPDPYKHEWSNDMKVEFSKKDQALAAVIVAVAIPFALAWLAATVGLAVRVFRLAAGV